MRRARNSPVRRMSTTFITPVGVYYDRSDPTDVYLVPFELRVVPSGTATAEESYQVRISTLWSGHDENTVYDATVSIGPQSARVAVARCRVPPLPPTGMAFVHLTVSQGRVVVWERTIRVGPHVRHLVPALSSTREPVLAAKRSFNACTGCRAHQALVGEECMICYYSPRIKRLRKRKEEVEELMASRLEERTREARERVEAHIVREEERLERLEADLMRTCTAALEEQSGAVVRDLVSSSLGQ
jgi:hypothetical protein